MNYIVMTLGGDQPVRPKIKIKKLLQKHKKTRAQNESQSNKNI